MDQITTYLKLISKINEFGDTHRHIFKGLGSISIEVEGHAPNKITVSPDNFSFAIPILLDMELGNINGKKVIVSFIGDYTVSKSYYA